jgi:hypothetical protein
MRIFYKQCFPLPVLDSTYTRKRLKRTDKYIKL